jgi:hypothetical protein
MRIMIELRSFRALASLTLGLVVLFALEIPALAYPAAPSSPVAPELDQAPAAAAGAWLRAPTPLQLRRAMRLDAAAAKADKKDETPNKYVPTKEEGAVFTIAGAGLICGGGIFLGVGLAEFFPIVNDASGLVTAAVNPLTMIGVGFTLLFTGVAFLIHGAKTLTVVKKSEEASRAAELWLETAPGLRSTPRETVRPVPLFVF